MKAKQRLCFDAILCAMVLISTGRMVSAEAPRQEFQFLRIGEVQPRGWLLDQILMDATNGYGRVLEQLTERIELTVFDVATKTGLVKPKLGEVWWNGETTGNWLDGLIRTAYLSGDAVAIRQVDELVARILAMQEPEATWAPIQRRCASSRR
jgi:hypothetical protein